MATVELTPPVFDGKSLAFFQNAPSPARARFTTTQVVLDRVRPNGEWRREGRDAEKASNGTDGGTDGRGTRETPTPPKSSVVLSVAARV